MQKEELLLGLSHVSRPLSGYPGHFIRLLSAYDLMRCAVCAKTLFARLFDAEETEGEEWEALAGNASLAALCVVDEEGVPMFENAEQALRTLTAEELTEVAGQYAELRGRWLGEAGNLKKKLTPAQRMQWRVLRAFNRLPTDADVRAMSEGDYLFCYLNLLLDEEGEGWEEGGRNTGFASAAAGRETEYGTD